MTLDERFEWQLSAWSDMQDHLLLLRDLGKSVKSVTEFGLRGGVSTTAFLAARVESWTGYDIDSRCECPAIVREFADPLTKANFCIGPILGNSLLIPPIAETDLLMIDSYHSRQQVLEELARHSMRVRQYIVLHDTGHPFGMTDEDGTPGGIRAGVEQWRASGDGENWKLVHDSELSYGLQVWERDIIQ